MRYSDAERWTLINALHVAIDRYVDDATLHADNPTIADQFRRQAHDCQRLIDRLESETDGQ